MNPKFKVSVLGSWVVGIWYHAKAECAFIAGPIKFSSKMQSIAIEYFREDWIFHSYQSRCRIQVVDINQAEWDKAVERLKRDFTVEQVKRFRRLTR